MIKMILENGKFVMSKIDSVECELPKHFDCPTQVAFYDNDNECYVGGIAYRDEIICLCCGAVIEIGEFLSDMAEDAPHVKYPIIMMDWIDISNQCLGDAMFDSSTGEVVLN